MNQKARAGLCCLLGLAAVFSWLWVRSQNVTSAPVETIRFQEAASLDTAIRLVHGDDPVFSATLDEFIRCFNGIFCQVSGADYFPDASRWNRSSLSDGIHSPYPARQFRFCEDESVYSLPTVTVYTPLEDRYIQEITINFDEHSYTEVGFGRYRMLCRCTVMAFFPAMSEESAEKLIDEILLLGSQNVFDSDAWFGTGVVPCTLYYKEGIGIYPYDAIGDWRRFCILPVTEARLREFEQKGAVLHEME